MVNFVVPVAFLSIFISVSEAVPDIDKTVLKSDLQHIGCDVCMRSVSVIYDRTEKARSNAPYKKLKEEEIIDVIDKVCAVDTTDGHWMRTLDIEEYRDSGRRYLRLTEPGGFSTCGRECGTIEKSCINLFDEEIDRDELTVLIWQNDYESAAELQEKACSKLSKRCKTGNKNTALKNNSKRIDYPFKIITKDEIEMEKMKMNMKAGGGGQIFSTAELQEMNRGDDDEDEGDYKRGTSINENGDTVIRF